MRACYGCQLRTVGCHGKKPDGTWRCPTWGAEREARDAELAAAQADWDTENYMADQREARERRRKSHHIT